MTKLLAYTYDHLSCIADYGTPDKHSHLALHFIFSPECSFSGTADGAAFEGRAVFIDSDVPHTVNLDGCIATVCLFEPVSALGRYVKEAFLQEKSFYLPDEQFLDKLNAVSARYANLFHAENFCIPKTDDSLEFDVQILESIGWKSRSQPDSAIDRRITAVKAMLSELETIPHDVMKLLCDTANLSQSRLSHLFTEQAGIPLHRYLAFIKIQKAFAHVRNGNNLTQAALDAGFDSSSHLAATFKRMFGISFSQFLKSGNSISRE